MDRVDLSQYPSAEQPYAAMPFNSTMTDEEIQSEDRSGFASSADLVNYREDNPSNNHMLDAPGDFYTIPQGTKTVVRYRTLFPGQITVGAGQLAGFSIRETTGAAGATIRFRDGLDSNSQPFMFVSLAAGESVRDWFMPHGVTFPSGLWCEVSGAIEGSVYFAVEMPI